MAHSRTRASRATFRKQIGVAAMWGTERVTHLARRHGKSRKFVQTPGGECGVRRLALAAPLAETFPRASKAWAHRFALAVILIAHGSYRQVVELLRDLFGVCR